MIQLRNLLATLVAILAISLTGQAALAQVCNGENLLARLETEKPDVFRKIAEEATQTVNGDAVLWKIDGNGTASPSYLMGTIHMTDERVSKLSPRVKTLIEQSTIVALEIENIGDKAALQAELAKRPGLMVLHNGSLWDYIDPEMQDLVAGHLEKVGIPKAVAGRLQPWLPAMTLAISTCETKRGQAGHPVLDKVISDYATAQSIKVIGLESAIEQFTIMSSIPLQSQVLFLTDSASMRDRVDDFNETLIQAYLDRRVTWYIPFTRTLTEDRNEARRAAEDDFLRALIDQRNVNMADRAVPHLKDGKAFIAVGALHLPGDTGLVALLRKKGFDVTAVE